MNGALNNGHCFNRDKSLHASSIRRVGNPILISLLLLQIVFTLSRQYFWLEPDV